MTKKLQLQHSWISAKKNGRAKEYLHIEEHSEVKILQSIIRAEILLKWFWLQTNSFLKIWLLCVNFEKFASINPLMNLPSRNAERYSMVGLLGWISQSYCTPTKFSGMTSFVIIIISVNFQLKQLSAKFFPLTI